MVIQGATLFALRRAGQGLTWLMRRTPADVAERVSADAQANALNGFLLDLKARAKPFPPRGAGRVPIKTGALNESLHITGINTRRPRLRGREYGLYVQRRYGPIWLTAWQNYGQSARYRRAVNRAGAG